SSVDRGVRSDHPSRESPDRQHHHPDSGQGTGLHYPRWRNPWVRHLSCVAYDFAKIVSDQHLEQLRQSGQFEMQPPVSKQLLSRIRNKVADSTRITMECADL